MVRVVEGRAPGDGRRHGGDEYRDGARSGLKGHG